jgi:hypothetical protein
MLFPAVHEFGYGPLEICHRTPRMSVDRDKPEGPPTVKLTQLTLLFENVNSCERRRIGFSDVDAPQLSMLLTLAARAFVGMHSPQLLAASQPRPEVNLL